MRAKIRPSLSELDVSRDADGLTLIENEGALFRGYSRYLPTEVWSIKDQAWKPYTGEPKDYAWGYPITAEQAELLKR